MGMIKGKLISFCTTFLVIFWLGGALGAVIDSDRPLLQKLLSSSLNNHPISSSLPISCDCYPKQSNSHSNSWSQREQLLHQATILLDHLSVKPDCLVNIPRIIAASAYETPNEEVGNLETILLKNLINRLESLNKNDATTTNSTPNLPAISESTYNSIVNKYLELKHKVADYLAPEDAEIVQSALDDLHKTFMKIITGRLRNTELPNLCSKTLALDNQLKARDPPTSVSQAADDFIQSLSEALTGQNQVTILAICNCLNDLETSVATVVQNDDSKKLQCLLSNLLESVANVVVCGGDIGSNVIEVVQRYVLSIKRALQDDADKRSSNIYNSVLEFEDQLYKALIDADPGQIIATTPWLLGTSDPQTEEDYLEEIGELLNTVFGNRTNLIGSAVEILLAIKEPQNQSPDDNPSNPSSSESTMENLKKVNDLLKTVKTYQTDPIHVLEMLVKLLSTLPEKDITKVLDAIDPAPPANREGEKLFYNTAPMIVDGERFIIKEELVQQIDDSGNVVDILRTGTYNLFDPTKNVSSGGNYTVRNGTVQTDPNGDIHIYNTGDYDLNSPDNGGSSSTTTSVKRQGQFVIEDEIVTTVDEYGNRRVTENGTYLLTDPDAVESQSGNFIVENTISKTEDDGTFVVVKSGILRGKKSNRASSDEESTLPDGSGYFLFNDHLYETPSSDGIFGTGIYNLKNPRTNRFQSGTYIIYNASSTNNPDGSIDSITSGLIYTDGLVNDLNFDNLDPLLIVMNGAEFVFEDHQEWVTDEYGNSNPICTGRFIQNDQISQLTTIGNYIVQNLVSETNLDGSTDLLKFGSFSDIVYVLPSGETFSNSTDPGHNEEPPTSEAAEHSSLTKESIEALVNSLNPLKSASPEPNYKSFDVTDILGNGTSFIIDATAADDQSDIVPLTKAGKFHLSDPKAKISWSGSFEVYNYSTQEQDSGILEVTSSGRLIVDQFIDMKQMNPTMTGEANFFIKQLIVTEVDEETGIYKINERGTYSLTDVTSGTTKSGTYMVANLLREPRSDGIIQVVKSGVLFVDGSDFPLLFEPSNPSNHEGYSTFDLRMYPESDSNGILGTGTYDFLDPGTSEHLTGTIEILSQSLHEHIDGSIQREVKCVFYVDGSDPDSESIISNIKPEIKPYIVNGVHILLQDHPKTHVTEHGHLMELGTSEFIQLHPKTGIKKTGGAEVINLFASTEPDGNIRRISFAKFYFDDHTELTSADEKSDDNETGLLNNDDSSIVTDGMSFITDQYVTAVVDVEGNIIGTMNMGTLYLTDPVTKESRAAAFVVEDYSVEEIASSLSKTTESGRLDVIRLDGIAASDCLTNQANFTIKKLISTAIDGESESPITDAQGTYSLTDVNTGATTTGTFVVKNTIFVSNISGTINLVKSGFLYVKNSNVDFIAGEPVPVNNFLSEDVRYPERDSDGNLGKGLYSLNDPRTHKSISGKYVILDASNTTNPDGSITVSTETVFYVDGFDPNSPSDNSDHDLFDVNGAHVSFDHHFVTSENSDGHLTPKVTGNFTQTNPKNGKQKKGRYTVNNIVTYAQPDGNTRTMRFSEIVYDDKSAPTQTNEEPAVPIILLPDYYKQLVASLNRTKSKTSNPKPGVDPVIVPVTGIIPNKDVGDNSQELIGYLLRNEHILTDPVAGSNYGSGTYQITDSKSREFVTGNLVIQNATFTRNPDGSFDSTVNGVIHVDDSDSNLDYVLSVTNGANFQFDDHFTYIIDGHGSITAVGYGVFTQTDPKANTIKRFNYVINNVITQIESENVRDILTSGSITSVTAVAGGSSSRAPDRNLTAEGSKIKNFETKVDHLKESLQALLDSLDAIKRPKNNDPNSVSLVPVTSLEPVTTSKYNTGNNYVKLPREEVAAAIKCESLKPGDVVAVQTEKGGFLIARIQDSTSPVVFYQTNLADLTEEFATAERIWNAPETNFSKAERGMFDLVFGSSNPPCDTQS